MKPEAFEALERADRSLAKAELMLANAFPDEAGRLAYGAGLNATRAYIFERTTVFAKTHSGTNSEFSRLVRDDPAFSDEDRSFLRRSFKLKTAADYGDGQPADDDAAIEAVVSARSLVATVRAAIAALPKGEETS